MQSLRLDMTPRLRAFLWSHRIIPKPWTFKDLGQVKTLVFPEDLQVEPFTRHVFRRADGAMLLSSMGHMTYSHSALPLARIGAFCSIALGVAEMGDSHPTDRVTTHSLSYGEYYRNLAKEMGATTYRPWSSYERRPESISIGNDVWIGTDALLKGGITIGDGAVIGARAVVTRDVAPYAVVGGVPAKVIRHRFDPGLCERLAATRWWDYALKDLAQFSFDDPDRFCDAFLQARPGLIPRESLVIGARDLTELA